MRFFIYTLFLTLFGGSNAQAFMPDDGFGDATIDAFFQDFETVCLPFILHEADAFRDDDKALYDALLKTNGYDLQSRNNFEYIKTPPHTDFVSTLYDSFVKTGMHAKRARLYWNKAPLTVRQKKPAQRCELRMNAVSFDRNKIFAALKENDQRWDFGPVVHEIRQDRPPARKFSKLTSFSNFYPATIVTKTGEIGLYRGTSFSVCAGDEAGSIEVRATFDKPYQSQMVLPAAPEYISLSVIHKSCDEGAQ